MRAAALVLALVAGCGGGEAVGPPPIEVPRRAATAGDPLLAVLPAGANVVIELDLARLRGNPALGPVFDALAKVPRSTLGAWVETGGDALEVALALATGADAAVLASYRVGGSDAVTLIAVRGDGDLIDAQDLGNGVRVAGPPAEVARAREVVAGRAPSLADDDELMAVRAVAMPEKATGAWLRLAGRFDFDARVALAARLELDTVPTRMSAWADIADDLALVVLTGGERKGETRAQAAIMRRYARRLAASPLVRALGLDGAIQRARVDATGELARAIVVVSPARMSRVAALLVKQLSSPSPGKMPDDG